MANNQGNIASNQGLIGPMTPITAKADPFNPFPAKAMTPSITAPSRYFPVQAPMPDNAPATGAIKSHTVNPDGSTVTAYHNPDPPAPQPKTQNGIATQPVFSSSGGAVIPQGGAQGTPVAQPVTNGQPSGPTSSTGLLSSAPTSYQGIIGGLSTFNPFANPQVSGAYTNATNAQAELQDLKNKEAEALKTAGSQPMPVGEVLGRQGLLANYYTQKENAAASALQGYSTQYSAGFTGTGQQSNALSSAGGLVPDALRYGALGSNPTGAGGLDPQTAITNAIGQLDPTTGGGIGYTTLYNQIASAYGSVIANQLLPALQQKYPGFSVASSDAKAQGQQSTLQSVPAMTGANNAAKGIQTTITNFLQQNPDINSSNLALSNAAQQWLSGKQITDPRYQTLFNYVNEYISTLAPVLGVGGDTTNLKTDIARSFINPQAGASSIISVLQNTSQLADDKIKNLVSGTTGGGVVAGGTSPGTQSSGSGGLYNF